MNHIANSAKEGDGVVVGEWISRVRAFYSIVLVQPNLRDAACGAKDRMIASSSSWSSLPLRRESDNRTEKDVKFD